jgi:23S rRNA pseudouridine1911/1915/1917 synthase
MPDPGAFTIDVTPDETGVRLDSFVASQYPDISRSHAARLALAGSITVNGSSKKPGYRVRAGDRVEGILPAPEPIQLKPEPIPLSILYEDSHLLVINKQPGMVVHPAPGHTSGTLVNGLLYHCPDLGGIGGLLRPGIVHRLDKDTSGVMVIAKNAAAQDHLAEQFALRSIRKHYQALVHGCPQADRGRIRLPIGRHRVDRKRMSTAGGGRMRMAETLWSVKKRFSEFTLLELELKTGRTHQARVHCQSMGHPIVGDPVYGGRKTGRKFCGECENRIHAVRRQMLHARRLELDHPASGQRMTFTAPVAEDMARLLECLRGAAQKKSDTDEHG